MTDDTPTHPTVSPVASAEPGSSGTPVRIGSGGGADVDPVLLAETLEKLRPLLQQDGGDMELVEVADGTVRLRLLGACGTCPTSVQTLHAGIERILRDRVPGVEAVEAVNPVEI